jgi:acetylornithine deacetylase/succinyl-diaminopimelate desuccinylase-like protein
MMIRTILAINVVGILVLVTVMPSTAQIGTRGWVAAHQGQIVGELVELLAIPNVAADRQNIRRNADHLRAMLERRGFAAELLETTGNPLVYGELKVPKATRTLLLYAHYDGQPVEPKAWQQPDPFKPVLRTARVDASGKIVDLASVTTFDPEWRLYARSASDDKSPIVALCAAVDALKASGLAPTANLRVVLDGEEEAGSPSLVPAIGKYRDKFRADLMVIFDGPMHSSGRPTLVYGARGIVTMNLTVFGPRAGVHSGNYGNWIPNPAQRLASLLATMKDEDGRVLVPGFNDNVRPLTASERAMLDAVPDDSARMLKTFGVAAPEKVFERLQDALQYPTLNVRGLTSAHVGAGARTIIPDRATAAIDVRLVKETPAADLVEKIRAHVRARGYTLVDADPDDVMRERQPRLARIQVSEPTEAFRTSPDDPQARQVAVALEKAFGAPPVRLRTLGGTVPIAPFVDAMGFPAILIPTVNFDNNQHEENENLRLGHLFQAVEIIAALVGS